MTGVRVIDVRARPELETHQRPDPLRVIARAGLVLPQQGRDLRRPRPAALAAAGIEGDVAGPADHLFLDPAAQRHAEAALGPRQYVGWHPRPNHFAKQPLG